MSKSFSPGYSGKPLAEKLGLKRGMNAIAFSSPTEYNFWLGNAASALNPRSSPPWDFVHVFTNNLEELEEYLKDIRHQIQPDGMVWISWYKKSTKRKSEITEDLIRDTCLPLGFVDIKVCAVSDEWSGLKLVIRKKEREKKVTPH
jgi:hypothetical protein